MLDLERVVANSRFAKAAVDVALNDAWARSLGVPVHTLLGGAFRRSIDVTWALGAAPAAEIVEEAQAKLDARMNFSFKLKMGALDPEIDTRRIVDIAEALHGKAGVRVDINARWDRLTALKYLPRLADGGVELIEQPTPGEQIDVLAELNHLLPVPVMADESVQTPHDALNVVRRGAADVIALKTTKCGGLQRSREIVAIAKAAGVACHGATSIEGRSVRRRRCTSRAPSLASTSGPSCSVRSCSARNCSRNPCATRTGSCTSPTGRASASN